MGLMDSIRNTVINWLWPNGAGQDERAQKYYSFSDYYTGAQRRQLRVKIGQADDNLTVNLVTLVIDRGISMLLGDGVTFDLPGDDPESPEQEYIDATWNANKRDILLYKASQYSAIYGTGFFKTLPGVLPGDNTNYTRLVALDPRWVRVEHEPNDMDTVKAYDMRYVVTEEDERGRAMTIYHREYTVKQTSPGGVVSWLVQEMKKREGGKWELVNETAWEYDFPPILHWQNLPQPGDCYGESDIADVMEIQDRLNFIASNISKIIRYHAHPKTWGKGVNLGNKSSWGADEMVTFPGDNAALANLEMQSDLSSSQQFMMVMRQLLFDVSRTVDITSIADKIGALTNFGLRVLYTDTLHKRDTKRALMGEALTELNRRLLILGNFKNTDPGAVVWPETMPQNKLELIQAVQAELGAGIVSKQTAAGELGRDWEEESGRMAEETSAGGNIGAALLNAFNQGR